MAGAVSLRVSGRGGTSEVLAKVGADGKGKRKGKRSRARRGGASAEAKTKPGNHCFVPDTDADLNETYGVSAQIVTGFCPEVRSGQRWVAPGAPWSMNDSACSENDYCSHTVDAGFHSSAVACLAM